MGSYNIKELYDVGCGDWQYMSKLKVPEDTKYYGYDIVDSVIQENNRLYSNSSITFSKIDGINFIDSLVTQFSTIKSDAGEKLDLLLVKDVFQHWDTESISNFCTSILPFFKLALIVVGGDDSVFYQGVGDIIPGGYRALNILDPDIDKPNEGHWDMLFSYYMNVKDDDVLHMKQHQEHKEVFLYTNLSINHHLKLVHDLKLESQSISQKFNSNVSGITNFHLYQVDEILSQKNIQELDNDFIIFGDL
jgi:hypothetical protein